METIKNILSSNKKDGPTGEGSHLAAHDHEQLSSGATPNTSTAGAVGPQAMEPSTLSSGAAPSSGITQNPATETFQTGNASNPTTNTGDLGTASTGVAADSHSQAYTGSGVSQHGQGNNTAIGSTATDPALTGTEDQTLTGVSAHSSSPGNTGHSGPHTTEVANRLDPAVNLTGVAGLESAHHHSHAHGGGAEAADQQHGGLSRDAAIGTAAGIGAAGVAEGEHHNQHHHQHEHDGSSVAATGGSGSQTLGTQGGSAVGSGTHQTQTTDAAGSSSHIRRDAAIGATAGAGVAGVTEAEHRKHHQQVDRENERGAGIATGGPDASQPIQTGTEPTRTTPTTQESSHRARDGAVGAGAGGLAEHVLHEHGAGDTAVASGPEARNIGQGDYNPQTGTFDTIQNPAKLTSVPLFVKKGTAGVGVSPVPDSAASQVTTANPASQAVSQHGIGETSDSHAHLGRDPAVAGGVGAGAYEAEKHHQKHDKDLTQAERDAKKEHKHELKEEKREHKESKGSFLSNLLHRDKNKHDKDYTSATDTTHSGDHHVGRDAALVGGGAALAEHERAQHSDAAPTVGTPLDQKPVGRDIGDILHGAERNRGVVGASGFPGTEGFGSGVGESPGVDSSTSHTTSVPLDQKPVGTDLGDKLHGVERNRGVAGSSGIPGTEGFGTGTTTTTATTSTGATTGNLATEETSGTSSGAAAATTTGTTTGTTANTTTGTTGATTGANTGFDESGRNFPLSNAATESTSKSGLGPHAEQYGTSDQSLDNATALHTTTTSSAAGLGPHAQQFGTPSQDLGTTTGTAGDSSFLSGNDQAVEQGDLSGGRNRLHKDPPAGHPAHQAQSEVTSGVPASESERKELLHQGEASLDDKTGVANAHADTKTDAY